MLSSARKMDDNNVWAKFQRMLSDLSTIQLTQEVSELMGHACQAYKKSLRSSVTAKHYLAGRGIAPSSMEKFSLGYAARSWNNLGLLLKHYSERVVDESRLRGSKKAPDQQRCYDFFRDRIMFPIRNREGEVIGFGGRTLHGDQPKYLNSSESVVFHKRKAVYGIFEAQAAIRKKGVSLMLEGYLDVITVAQAGVTNVVGSMGTACTRYQIAELLSIAPCIVFCFDGDLAGRRAAVAAMEMVLPFAGDDFSFGIAFLPAGEDPDSYVMKHGIEAFQAVIDDALPLHRLLRLAVTKQCDLDCVNGRVMCATRGKAYWKQLPEGEVKSDLLQFCASAIELAPASLEALWLHE